MRKRSRLSGTADIDSPAFVPPKRASPSRARWAAIFRGRWSIRRSPSRAQRLEEFFRRLVQHLPVASGEEALALLTETLNEVEDELTGIPYNPESWATDGRLYPPFPDSRRPVPGHPDVVRWRSKGHNTYIRTNGAVEIAQVLDGTVVFRATGRNGKGVWDD